MKRFNLYTPIKHQRKKRINDVINLTIDWCINKWGVSKVGLCLDICYKEHTPSYIVSKGEYDIEENEIIIYPSNNSNIRDLVDTVIHEFTHHRQDMSKYHKVLLKSGYDNHPLEIESNETAKKYRKVCWYSIRNLINL